MGEYAIRKSDNQRIKIGTCESMYYLRYEDRNKVSKEPSSLCAASTKNLFWRLPFPDEDRLEPGEYEDFNRGLRLYKTTLNRYTTDYICPELGDNYPGVMQLHHAPSGLLVNVACHHGEKLPDVGGAKTFWNGKGHSYELAFLKNTENGILPVIRCRHCGNMWRKAWEDIWDYLTPEWRVRLAQYKREADKT